HATKVKSHERKATNPAVFGDQSRDQVAGYHEEDVYTDETAGKPSYLRMKQDNGKYCEGAKPINVLPVLHASLWLSERGTAPAKMDRRKKQTAVWQFGATPNTIELRSFTAAGKSARRDALAEILTGGEG